MYPSINLSLAVLPGLTGCVQVAVEVSDLKMFKMFECRRHGKNRISDPELKNQECLRFQQIRRQKHEAVNHNLELAQTFPGQNLGHSRLVEELVVSVKLVVVLAERRKPGIRKTGTLDWGNTQENHHHLPKSYLNLPVHCKERYTKLKQDDLSKHMFKVLIERMERRINMDPFCYTYNKYILLCNWGITQKYSESLRVLEVEDVEVVDDVAVLDTLEVLPLKQIANSDCSISVYHLVSCHFICMLKFHLKMCASFIKVICKYSNGTLLGIPQEP